MKKKGLKKQGNWKFNEKGQKNRIVLPGLERYLQFQKPHNVMHNKI